MTQQTALQTVQMLDEMQANNWQPLQTMVLDGWLLRFADGYSKRANCILPLYPSSSDTDADDKIAECERLYDSRGQRTVFRLSPAAQPADLDEKLERRGYTLIDRCSIQVLALGNTPAPAWPSVRLEPAVTDEWLDHYCRLAGATDANKPTMRRMLANIRTKAAFVTLLNDNRVVACGFGVIERGYIGLWDIVTDGEYRRRGFGEQLLLHLLQWGRQSGAHSAYLVVVADNQPALKLYAKLGFQEQYQTWYRIGG